MLNTYEQQSKLKLAATIITVLVIAGVVLLADYVRDHNKSSSIALTQISSSSTKAATNNSTTATSTASSSASGYKDGTYAATENYEVPHGQEEIQVNLTIASGTITNATIQNSESDNDSARYQQDFAAEYKSYVVGKKIDGLQLSTIAGASDTTQGFNDAIDQIASQAKV